jgi:putative phage-type endonuclease
MNRQEWLKERKNYLGGSDIGAICGINKYKTALDVYMDKTSDEVEEVNNNYTHWGNILENVVANEYAKVTGNKVVEPIGTIYHPEHSFLAANIDRFVNGGDYILECKTANNFAASDWGQEGTDEIPESYKCQVAYYAGIADVSKVDIAVLIGGNDFRIYRYMRDRKLESQLFQIAINFWNKHIIPRQAPEARNANDLDILYPESNGSQIEICDSILQDVKRLKELKAQAESIEYEAKGLKENIKKYMKDNELLVDATGHEFATWKTQKARKSLDTKALQLEHQDIYQQYLHECKAPRVLRLK